VYLGKSKKPSKATFKADGKQFQLQFSEGEQYYSMRGVFDGKRLTGYAQSPSGERSYFEATPAKAKKSKSTDSNKSETPQVGTLANSQVPFPLNGYGRLSLPQAEDFVVRNATVWTNTDQGILVADVWVENSAIKAVGKDLSVPQGVKSIDGTGKHLTTGIIDEHSHASITQGTNEGTHSVSAEVRVEDAINPGAINLYRHLAGGTTTSQLLHGSANPIGGQSAIVKLRWGQDLGGLLLINQPPFIKFALGENVKRSNRSRNYNVRYPQTRMGVEQMIKDAFREAKAYRQQWDEWEKNGEAQNLIMPKTDLQLETLLEILDDRRFITCHSYVQSEITMLMRLAEAEGFRINTFTHILEGYKVADKMAAHGATGSTFSDWWAYKYEVIDAIPYNAALMQMAGVNVCINSDDREMARRLNQEAAKAIKYGGVTEEEAWKMVTLNAAKALNLEGRLGSMDTGKDADLVLWNTHPMSIYAKPQQVWIDGTLYFDIATDMLMRQRMAAERQRILTAMRAEAKGDSPSFPGRSVAPEYGCDHVGGLED
ncbi:MAG: amidohydrolase, partial [Bacteroidia bacterium]